MKTALMCGRQPNEDDKMAAEKMATDGDAEAGKERYSEEQCSCKTNCIEGPLRKAFQKHGRYIAKHPYPFFVIPLILAACLGYGLRYFELENDTEYLVTPKNGPAKAERRLVQQYFHVDQTDGFLPERSPVLDGFTDVLIAASDGGNILSPKFLQSVINLDKFIRNITALDDADRPYGFEAICSTWKGNCIDHPLLLVFQRNATLANFIKLTYPTFNYIFLGHSLGNVTLMGNTSYIERAQATRMTYYVKYESAMEQELAHRWFQKVRYALEDYEDPNLVVYHCATNSLTTQFDEASEDIMPKFAAPFILLITFSILSCMMNDWVRSKPWLAFTGVFSTGLSLASTFGLLSALGIKAVPQVGLVPFLTLGVGVDNMFILISAWRRTDVDGLVGMDMARRVEIRMGEAMKEAALSITITSLTDVLAFGIGAITDFPTVELFCLYTGLSIVFSYIYCITFFTAGMVFSGWREESNRHCFALNKVLSKKEAEDRSGWYRIFCAGGKPGKNENDQKVKDTHASFMPVPPEESKNADTDHLMMRFFKNYFGPLLMKPWMKALVLLVYVGYISVAIYGCIHMRKGVSFYKMSNVNSYLANYYHYKDVYFDQFGPAVSVVITEPLDYSDTQVQNQIFKVLETFENDTDYFYANGTQSWLRDYLHFLQYFPKRPQNEVEFIEMLRYQFLKIQGYDRHKLDISFNDEGTKIIACRFYVQSRWYAKTEDMMVHAREVAETIDHLKVSIFHQTFTYFDQPVVVWHNTLQNIVIAIVCMFLVAMMFVPSPVSAFWVTIATASIEAGVIGYMTLWDVNVDFISMTYLILCIGFSVDFSVHITYGFIASEEKTGNKKAIDALYILGYPVLQSGTSTILGVIFLSTAISYLFLSFFKTMLLVIIFGVWHAIFVLPVVLSLLSGRFTKCSEEECSGSCKCAQNIKSHGHNLTEKGKLIIPTIFRECEDCTSDNSSVVSHDKNKYLFVAEKCSVV